MDWYARNGPYDVLIDGANVAFYGQNRPQGGFNWPQLIAMYELVVQKHPAPAKVCPWKLRMRCSSRRLGCDKGQDMVNLLCTTC